MKDLDLTAADNNNIEYLVEKYGNMILRLAFSYVKNLQEAEDITQEVFIKLTQNSIKFENENHRKAWILRITINLCKNRLKLFWNRNTCSIDDISGLSKNDTYDFDNNVLAAVMKLPSRQRTIIYLYYYEGYKINEIASILKKRETTIRSDMHRARQKLKTILKEEYDFE